MPSLDNDPDLQSERVVVVVVVVVVCDVDDVV